MIARRILEDMAAGRCALMKPDWSDAGSTIRKLLYKLHVNGVIDQIGEDACIAYVHTLARAENVPDSVVIEALEGGFASQYDTDTSRIDMRLWLPDLKPITKYEYAGPCPKCGGTDRFHLKQSSTGWGCFCRHCTGAEGQWMDAIEFLRWRDGLSFKDACKALALPPVAASAPRQLMAGGKVSKKSDERLAAIARSCAKHLRSADLKYLELRGISEQLSRKFYIGYSGGGKIHDLYVPRGITIPCWDGDQVAYIKVRTGEGYKQPKGGRSSLYIARPTGQYAIVTETELDALMLAQRIVDRGLDVAVYATGSVSWNTDKADSLSLRHSLWSAFDNDEAGRDATRKWGVPSLRFEGKDIGDVFERDGWIGIDNLFSQMLPAGKDGDHLMQLGIELGGVVEEVPVSVSDEIVIDGVPIPF